MGDHIGKQGVKSKIMTNAVEITIYQCKRSADASRKFGISLIVNFSAILWLI